MTAASVSSPSRAGWLAAYRDDGPLALALGRLLGPRLALPAPALVASAALPLAVALALGGVEVPHAALAPGVAALVLLGGAASGRPRTRFDWLVPGQLRLLEYGLLLWMAVLAGGWATRSCFGLLAALAFRHYDVVYRLRNQGVAPPRWVWLLGGGWELRLILAYVALLAAASAVGMLVAAVALAVVSVGEATRAWLEYSRARRPAIYAEEEDEDE
ncbi:MAG: hypothetical protein IRZ21_10830 [Thermoleophilaceae bacterium]|nr:hypothetical protein [Thermoleophilaceae bacterium]